MGSQILKRAAVMLTIFTLPLLTIAQSITGTITDDQGVTLPGVTIRIDGTTKGTTSDLDGRYTIKDLPIGEVSLVYTFIGFQEQRKTFQVGAGQSIKADIGMALSMGELDEVVVVGYGTQRRREVTGSIAKIGATELTNLPVPSFEAALQGQAAGVQLVQGGGLAGSSSVIRVRGIASISAGGDPLIVIDGIPISQNYFVNESGGDRGAMNNNPLAFLNPNDIESIEILKDAASTGIYGARGANGVVLITTKRGNGLGKQPLQIDFSTRFGISRPVATPNMLNSEEYLQLRQEAWENDGNTGLAPLPGGISWEDARNTNTNWVDETVRTGIKQMYNLALNKSWEKVSLAFNTGWEENESYLKGNSYNRFSSRMAVDYQLHKKVKVGGNFSWYRGDNERIDAGWSGGYGAALSTALPIYPIFYEEDVYNEQGDLLHRAGDYFIGGPNPVRDRELKDRRQIEQRTLNNVYLQVEPVKNLTLRAEGRYEYMDNQDYLFIPFEYDTNNNGLAKVYPTWDNNYNYSLTANYRWMPGEKNNFDFLVGHEYQYATSYRLTNVQYTDLDRPFYQFNGTPTVDPFGPKRPDFEEFSFISYFARVNFVRNSKYILQGTFRTDGSSRFGGNNKWGFFPSASAGWIVSDESFMDNVNFVSFLKLRASYGLTGNANIPNYQYLGTYLRDEASYLGQDILYPDKLENPDLRWETSNTFDGGIEFGLLDDRISGNLVYYNKMTRDVLLNVNLPSSVGFDTYWDNVGQILNRGIEFDIKTHNLKGRKLKWVTEFNIANNYNEIVSIGDYSEDAVSGGTNDTRTVVGYPVGTSFLVRFSHVDDATGRPVYLDIDGNETFEWDPANRVPVGDILPDVVGGLTNTFTLRRWDFGFLIYYSFGGKVYDSSSKRQLGVVTDWNMRTELFDRWQQPGDDATYPRLTMETATHGSATPWINTDLWLHDADYIRLRRVAVGYTIPDMYLKNKQIRNLRFEVSATNLLLFTNFPGLDPEIVRDFENQTDRNMSAFISYLSAPVEQTINFQINLSF
jgi:TonB-linked SusC/RagA family outer membrane protein